MAATELRLGLGETTARLELFTAFATPSVSTSIAATANANASAADSSVEVAAAAKAASSDFVLIGAVDAARSALQHQLAGDGYASTDSESLLYRRERWSLVQEGSFHERVPFRWARFQHSTTNVTTTCLGVAEWNESYNDGGDAGEPETKRASTLLAYIAATCKPSDVVAVVLTSPASSAALAALQTRDAAGASERLVEASARLFEQPYLSPSVSVSSLPVALSSRLFLRMPSAICVDKAATAIVPANASSTGLALDLCSGADCKVCKPSNFASGSASGQSASSSRNHTVAIVVSCGVFLAASAAVIFVLFRRQFFSPASATKEEKDLTTNLAYVLRI